MPKRPTILEKAELYDLCRQAADEYGPHVFESIVCSKCKNRFYSLHPFCESLSCAWCLHRNATKWESILTKVEDI